MEEVYNENEVVSVDWCNDTVRESLPWDPEQFIEVRRLTGKERRRKKAIASRFTYDRKNKSDGIDVNIAVDDLKEFEYTHCITDFKLKVKDKNNNLVVLTFGSARENMRVYDHFNEKMEDFVDSLIAKVNKESIEEDSEESVSDIEGN